jgi:SnoaL-like domain
LGRRVSIIEEVEVVDKQVAGGPTTVGLDVGADAWAIAAVKAQYFRFIDLKDWDGFRSIFTDDAVFDHPTIGTYDDIDVAVKAVSELIGDMWTFHEGSIPDITLLGPDRAAGIFAMSSHSLPPGREGFARTFGHYHDEFRRVDGVWRLSSMKLVSTFRDR